MTPQDEIITFVKDQFNSKAKTVKALWAWSVDRAQAQAHHILSKQIF